MEELLARVVDLAKGHPTWMAGVAGFAGFAALVWGILSSSYRYR
ncbi:MAG: hypothetical protein ACRDI1_00610 [Actinomycetota bacterium]